MQNSNILYLSYDGLTDPLGQSQILPYVIGLTKIGYSFTIISFEKGERYELYSKTIQTICDKNSIDWKPLIYTKKPPVLSTVWDIIRMNKLSKKIWKEKSIKLIHCRSYITALIGLGFKQKHNTTFLFDMRGFWADERVDGKIWSLSNPLLKYVYNFFKSKEIEFVKHSDAIISLTEKGKLEILKWNISSVSDDKINVIPCCVDTDLFNLASINSVLISQKRTELGYKDSDKILGYIGSIGTWYMLPEMLDFFYCKYLENSNLRFLFVTGEPKSVIESVANEKNIPLHLIKVVSCLHAEVPLYASLFDISVFFIKPSYSKMASSPTKQGELMAMGVPVVCNAGVGDTDAIVQKYNSGFVLNQFENNAYNSIDLYAKAFDKSSISKGATDYFSLESGVRKYAEVYKKII